MTPTRRTDEDVGFEPVPLVLELHRDLEQSLGWDRDDSGLRAQLHELRVRVSRRMGLHLPAINTRPDEHHLGPNEYALIAYDEVLATGVVDPDEVFLLASPDLARKQGVEVRAAALPGTRRPIAVVAADRAADLPWDAMTAPEAILHHVELKLRQHADRFLGIQETSRLIESVREQHPQLVQAVTPSMYPLNQVREVLRRLLREQVSIRDLRGVLEAMGSIETPEDERTVARVVEQVRVRIAGAICADLCVGRKRVQVYEADPTVVEKLRAFVMRTLTDPSDRSRIREAIDRRIDPHRHPVGRPVLLVPRDLRLTTVHLIHTRIPDVASPVPGRARPLVPGAARRIRRTGSGEARCRRADCRSRMSQEELHRIPARRCSDDSLRQEREEEAEEWIPSRTSTRSCARCGRTSEPAR